LAPLKESSLFGKLIGAIAEEMANLPDTAGTDCDKVVQKPDGWRPRAESNH
jgi:hypothetical protein